MTLNNQELNAVLGLIEQALTGKVPVLPEEFLKYSDGTTLFLMHLQQFYTVDGVNIPLQQLTKEQAMRVTVVLFATAFRYLEHGLELCRLKENSP